MKPRLIELHRRVTDKPGYLVPIEDIDVGFPIRRMFYITGFSDDNNVRGGHGHVNTTELVLCIAGTLEIEAGGDAFTLADDTTGLLIPPGNFIKMKMSRNAIVLVICDTVVKDAAIYTTEEHLRTSV